MEGDEDRVWTDDGDDPIVTKLFDEWVASHEAGEEPDTAALAERAGGRADELRRRIRVYRTLEEGLRDEERQAGLARIGRFLILGSLGRGGLGEVYLALDPELKRQVALKVLRPGIGGAGEGRGWILNEARSLARIHHPGVVRVFEVLREESTHFVVMEHLPGPTLAQAIEELRRIRRSLSETGAVDSTEPETDAARAARLLEAHSARVRVLLRLADALAHCHDRGILHRDVKPANVLFDEKDQPRLVDFGLAHLEGDDDEETSLDITQSLVASPAYMAPEQIEHGRTGADPRTDQFSFGILAYELLTLENPFQRKDRQSTLDAIARTQPPALRKVDPTIPPDLERVVLHTLAHRPEDRYASMAAVREDLLAVLDHRPIRVSEPSPWHVLRLWARRNRRRVMTVVAAVLVLAAALVSTRVLELRQRRTRIESELSSGRLSGELTPLQLGVRLRELLRLKEAALALDQSPLSRLLFGSAGTVVAHAGFEASKQLLGAYHMELTRAEKAGTTFQPANWSNVILLDELVSPDAPGMEDLRNRGRVMLDPEGNRSYDVEAFELHSDDNNSPFFRFPELRPVTFPEFPTPGLYRLRVRPSNSGDAWQEIDVPVTEVGGPCLRLRPRAPDRELLDSCVQVAPGALIGGGHPIIRLVLDDEESAPENSLAGREVRHAIPGFRITGAPVTRAQFQRFLDAAHPDGIALRRSTAPPDEPAWVTGAGACAFARWAGGRLPTLAELLLATRRGMVRTRFELLEGTSNSLRRSGEYVFQGGPSGEPSVVTTISLEDLAILSEDPARGLGWQTADWSTFDDYTVADPKGTPPGVYRAGLSFHVVFP